MNFTEHSSRTAKIHPPPQILGPVFGRTDSSRSFIFGQLDFFADFVVGFSLLIFVRTVPRKVLQENPRRNPPKFTQQKSPTHISAQRPGQQMSPIHLCRQAGPSVLVTCVCAVEKVEGPKQLALHIGDVVKANFDGRGWFEATILKVGAHVARVTALSGFPSS